MTKVNPQVLRWARETAGLTLESAADAIGLKSAKGVSGAERLSALERGEDDPSRALLNRIALRYRRPLLTFYLDHIPAKGDRGEDFRTISGVAPRDDEPLLDALLRDIRARHSLVLSFLEEEGSEPVSFVGSQSLKHSPAQVAKDIAATIDFNLRHFRVQHGVAKAFGYLRDRLEQAGIFVLLMGNLGSHHSNVSPMTFRGFAIADSYAPFIVINDQDARAAWSFTALHEAAHLWLGQSGISGPSIASESAIERFCNDVASHLLLPSDELFSNLGYISSLHDGISRISAFAKERNLSRRMVAYHLMRHSLIDGALWNALNDHFHAAYLASKKRGDDEKSGGVSFYVVRRHRLGQALVGLVDRAVSQGAMSYTKASVVLGVKPGTVASVLRPPTSGGPR